MIGRCVSLDEGVAMFEDIDPYHRWLGIPAEKQPAN